MIAGPPFGRRGDSAKDGAPCLWDESNTLLVFFEDIERVAAMELHADGAQNGAHRAGGAALFADDLAHILRSDTQLEDGAFVPADGLDLHSCRLIDQCLGDL